MNSQRIAAAVKAAAHDGRTPHFAPSNGITRTRHVAIGDPQAPLVTFLTILERHGLLGDDGRLADDVHLVSIGDHFDYGPATWRGLAASDGFELLAWLASHPRDQTTIVLGNHDLVRIDQLATYDLPSFDRARADADRAYNGGERIEALERAFVARWPQFTDSESIARDYSTFTVKQRGLVGMLVREQRAVLGYAHSPTLLLVHAGLTRSDLKLIGAPENDATAIAAALEVFLQQAVAKWSAGGIDLLPLHRPASGVNGPTRGCFSHRPANPAHSEPGDFFGPPRKRFDPRELPGGITQAIGHIRDNKCRALLGEWAVAEPTIDGPLRSLTVDGSTVRYARGLQADPRLIFLDGGMSTGQVETYELLDLDTLAVLKT